MALQVRGRAAGSFYLGNKDIKIFNGPVHVLTKFIRSVMPLAAKSECGALFMSVQEEVMMRQTLEELGHKKPPTPIRTDNSTACGIMNKP